MKMGKNLLRAFGWLFIAAMVFVVIFSIAGISKNAPNQIEGRVLMAFSCVLIAAFIFTRLKTQMKIRLLIAYAVGWIYMLITLLGAIYTIIVIDLPKNNWENFMALIAAFALATIAVGWAWDQKIIRLWPFEWAEEKIAQRINTKVIKNLYRG
jgi:hypothetical protein